MRAWIVIAAILAVLLAGFVYAWVGADREATRLGEEGDSLRILNREIRARQQGDSARLASEQRAFARKLDSIDAQRRDARQEAEMASLSARAAGTTLRELLDSLGASTASLDSLEAAEYREDQAQAEELAAADSATAVVRSLLEVTESALASERALRQGVETENMALRAQVQALNRARAFDRWAGAGAIAAIVTGLLILR